jgi:hypothetical protein
MEIILAVLAGGAMVALGFFMGRGRKPSAEPKREPVTSQPKEPQKPEEARGKLSIEEQLDNMLGYDPRKTGGENA